MAREVATSRELATRQSANRENQMILEHDYMVWQKAADNQWHLNDLFSYLQYASPFTLQFMYQITDQYKGSTCILSCINWPGTDGKNKGLRFTPETLYFSSDNTAGKRIVLSYININKKFSKQLITLIFDKNNSDILQNKTSIRTGITDTCEDFTMESANLNFGMQGVLYPISQQISHFQIWNKAISTSEIEYCYDVLVSGQSLVGTEDGLVCYFPLQEGSGTALLDVVGSRTGVITGAEWRDYGGLRETA